MVGTILGPPSTTCQISAERIATFEHSKTILEHLKLASGNSNYTPGQLNWQAFQTRLKKFNGRLAIVILEVVKHSGYDFVQFADGSWKPLSDVLTKTVANSRASFLIYIFCETELTVDAEIIPENILFVRAGTKEIVLEASLAAHVLSNAWLSETAYKTDFTQTHLIEILTKLAFNISATIEYPNRTIVARNSSYTLWQNSDLNYLPGVDIDRFREDLRYEQKLDTLKRLLDEETAAIGLHSTIQARCAAAQALFWLLSLKINAEQWWPLSRTASIVNPSSKAPFINRRTKIKRNPASKADIDSFLSRFLIVQQGEYYFGFDHDKDGSEPPAPPHKRKMAEFRILDSPVTLGDWLNIAQSPYDSSLEILDSDLPITEVNAAEAMDFAKIVSELAVQHQLIPSKWAIRLPTEFEWEAAARLGQNYHYPWGEVYQSMNCNADQRFGHTTPVDKFVPSGISHTGCRDMSGNVREWTSSRAGPKSEWVDYRRNSPLLDPSTVRPDHRLVIRGGSYSFDPKSIRTWVRNTQIAGRDDIQTGFRLVMANADGCSTVSFSSGQI